MTRNMAQAKTLKQNDELTRRALLAFGAAAGSALALVAAAQPVRAEDDKGSHDGHDGHAGHGGAKHQKLINEALRCINNGETCAAHCIELLGKGNTALKPCLASVSGMLAMCGALVRLASLDAPRLKELAKVCLGVCEDCEKECRKHEKDHVTCKDCADSCAACAKECKALLET